MLGVAALAGLGVGLWPLVAPNPVAARAAAGEPIGGCRVTDGDTIRCGDERIRLLGIDAPEMGGRCRPGRDCAPGDPIASKNSLATAMTGALTIERFGADRYGRTLALVAGAKGDLSCWQLRHDQARYVARWDIERSVDARCAIDGIDHLD